MQTDLNSENQKSPTKEKHYQLDYIFVCAQNLTVADGSIARSQKLNICKI